MGIGHCLVSVSAGHPLGITRPDLGTWEVNKDTSVQRESVILVPSSFPRDRMQEIIYIVPNHH